VDGQHLAVLDDGRVRAGARSQRQHAGDRGVERVERHDAHAPRVLDDPPAAHRVAAQYVGGSVGGDTLVLRVRSRPGPRRLKGIEHAQAHLRGGLARERNGENLFGVLDDGEELQVSLDQQFRLARPGRRLDDERAADVECGVPRAKIVRPQPLLLSRHGTPRETGSGPRAGALRRDHGRR
jgi:hypothetical protein